MPEAYWELIADKLKAAGWSLGWNRIGNAGGIVLWHVDSGQNGLRFIAQAEELTTAFLEAERMIEEQGGPAS